MNYGYFDDPNREYVITDPRTPTKWINYIGTLQFGGFVDHTGGALICKTDPTFNRITKYIQQMPSFDFKGETLYLRIHPHAEPDGEPRNYQVFSPFFGQRRHEEADRMPIILGCNTDIGRNNSPLDGLQHIFFPGLNIQCACIGHGNITYLVDGCRVAIIVNYNSIYQSGSSLAGADFYQFCFEVIDGLLHMSFRV